MNNSNHSIAQLASLYHQQSNLFSQLIDVAIRLRFAVFWCICISYWTNHYVLIKLVPLKKKNNISFFIDLILVNTIIPLQFTYAKTKVGCTRDLISLLNNVSKEKMLL
jgi:hypothetical protein